jgi:hypothetical protein
MTMTIAQSKVELAQKLLQTQDKQILKTVELIFSRADEDFELSDADKREIDVQLKEIESGKAKFYTMAEVKKMVRKNHKKSVK